MEGEMKSTLFETECYQIKYFHYDDTIEKINSIENDQNFNLVELKDAKYVLCASYYRDKLPSKTPFPLSEIKLDNVSRILVDCNYLLEQMNDIEVFFNKNSKSISGYEHVSFYFVRKSDTEKLKWARENMRLHNIYEYRSDRPLVIMNGCFYTKKMEEFRTIVHISFTDNFSEAFKRSMAMKISEEDEKLLAHMAAHRIIEY